MAYIFLDYLVVYDQRLEVLRLPWCCGHGSLGSFVGEETVDRRAFSNVRISDHSHHDGVEICELLTPYRLEVIK